MLLQSPSLAQPPSFRHFPLQQGIGGGRGAEEGIPQDQPQGVKADAAADGDRLSGKSLMTDMMKDIQGKMICMSRHIK